MSSFSVSSYKYLNFLVKSSSEMDCCLLVRIFPLFTAWILMLSALLFLSVSSFSHHHLVNNLVRFCTLFSLHQGDRLKTPLAPEIIFSSLISLVHSVVCELASFDCFFPLGYCKNTLYEIVHLFCVSYVNKF